MVLNILKDAEATWREIVKLATPLDSNKKVVIKSNPKSPSDFEAYTDNRKIYISLNDEKKFRKNFEDIVVPAYKIAANRLYDVKNPVSELELLTNLMFDTFLFVHFHEQLHPWLCPNSKYDEKAINKALYEGIKETEPSLTKREVLYKVNNSKNLVWDSVLNISFVSKTSGFNNERLEQKINYIFSKNNREIEYQPITHYPSGILPILYMTSAQHRTTDIPISLMGALYTTISYNAHNIRKKAMEIFLDDLSTKKMQNSTALDLVKDMDRGFVSELDEKELKKRGIDKQNYLKRVDMVDDLANPDYEDNQKYFVAALTKIFDTPSMRYESLRGLIKILSPYISFNQKQGSPDPNSRGGGGMGGTGRMEGEPDESDEGSGSTSEGGAEDYGDKSQEEMDEDSMSDTLDDLLGTLDEGEADDLMGEVANDDGCSGRGAGKPMPSKGIRRKVSILAADQYYKKNADIIEVHNPAQENISFDIGNKRVWKLVRSKTLTVADVSKSNYQKIMNFQKTTGLPVLMNIGGGFYKFNEYIQVETPLKSYTSQKTGIEIPDNWVLFQDSSRSMASSTRYVGSNERFDLLNRVKYGIIKGLYQICREMSKDLKFGIVNFSNTTDYKGLDSLIKIYEARAHPIKDISLIPQCGGTSCSSNVFNRIEKDLMPGKSIYTFITDGEIYGDTTPLYNAINRFASGKNHAFLFIEINSNSSFGANIKDLSARKPSVTYYRVNNVKDIKNKLSSVLIKYG